MKRNKLLLLLALLLTAVTGAWAQTETLLTTITLTGDESYNETTTGVVTVTPINMNGYVEDYGWCWYTPGSVTVEAKEGYTITRCVFKQNEKTPATITSSPFAITFDDDGHCEQSYDMDGVTSIEVYGYANVPAPAGYTVSMKDGVKDADKWTISPNPAEEGQTVTLQYNGRLKVKGVKATSDAAPAANPNAYMKWDNTKKELVEAEIPAEATTETNADTNVEWAAGTYVVEGDVTINGNITLGGNVDLIIKDGAKLTVNGRIHGSSSKYNLSIYGQANQSGQLVVNNPSGDAITSITTLEVHSCQVTASSSGNNRGGFYGIVTFNVYGGSVDAENTGATSGYGIYLSSSGSMNIYGGDVKAVGKGDNSTYSYGITGSSSITVTVYGGKLWAENAGNKALKSAITLAKGAGFTGKTETSDNGTSWTDLTTEGTPDAKYVRVGY